MRNPSRSPSKSGPAHNGTGQSRRPVVVRQASTPPFSGPHLRWDTIVVRLKPQFLQAIKPLMTEAGRQLRSAPRTVEDLLNSGAAVEDSQPVLAEFVPVLDGYVWIGEERDHLRALVLALWFGTAGRSHLDADLPSLHGRFDHFSRGWIHGSQVLTSAVVNLNITMCEVPLIISPPATLAARLGFPTVRL